MCRCARLGLSRRRSRVRVPSLPSLKSWAAQAGAACVQAALSEVIGVPKAPILGVSMGCPHPCVPTSPVSPYRRLNRTGPRVDSQRPDIARGRISTHRDRMKLIEQEKVVLPSPMAAYDLSSVQERGGIPNSGDGRTARSGRRCGRALWKTTRPSSTVARSPGRFLSSQTALSRGISPGRDPARRALRGTRNHHWRHGTEPVDACGTARAPTSPRDPDWRARLPPAPREMQGRQAPTLGRRSAHAA